MCHSPNRAGRNSREVSRPSPRVTVHDQFDLSGTWGRRAVMYINHMQAFDSQAVNLSRIGGPRFCLGDNRVLQAGADRAGFEPAQQVLQGIMWMRIPVLAGLRVHLAFLFALVFVLSG